METKDIIRDLRMKTGLSQEALAEKNIRHTSGCVTLGKRRKHTEYRNSQASFKAFRRVHQHSARLSAKARLSVLWYAS